MLFPTPTSIPLGLGPNSGVRTRGFWAKTTAASPGPTEVSLDTNGPAQLIIPTDTFHTFFIWFTAYQPGTGVNLSVYLEVAVRNLGGVTAKQGSDYLFELVAPPPHLRIVMDIVSDRLAITVQDTGPVQTTHWAGQILEITVPATLP